MGFRWSSVQIRPARPSLSRDFRELPCLLRLLLPWWCLKKEPITVLSSDCSSILWLADGELRIHFGRRKSNLHQEAWRPERSRMCARAPCCRETIAHYDRQSLAAGARAMRPRGRLHSGAVALRCRHVFLWHVQGRGQRTLSAGAWTMGARLAAHPQLHFPVIPDVLRGQ
jgi:hypothetical protein